MRLTTFSDYALRVLLFLATAPEGRGRIADIASAYRISEHHLVKVVHHLGREGLLANTRGRGGGLRLARPASQINVGHVVRTAEEPSVLVECFAPGGNCAITGSCRLAGALQKAHDAFYEVLDGFTLEDLLVRSQRMTQILHYPMEQRQ
jgi:Rrf2 family nitric oxide-sensitive transcriptional repressor